MTAKWLNSAFGREVPRGVCSSWGGGAGLELCPRASLGFAGSCAHGKVGPCPWTGGDTRWHQPGLAAHLPTQESSGASRGCSGGIPPACLAQNILEKPIPPGYSWDGCDGWVPSLDFIGQHPSFSGSLVVFYSGFHCSPVLQILRLCLKLMGLCKPLHWWAK